MWTLLFDYHWDRSPTHGYDATREARWRRSRSLAEGVAHGEGDDKVECTGAGDSVLRRDRDRPVGILARAMQSMAVRGFIEHDRVSGTYRLADSGRATLAMILDHAGIKVPPK
jgi:hypothetical protein